MSSLYATPREVGHPSDCTFYHTMDLPTLGTVQGSWDLRGRIDDYLGGVPLKGRRVLEVGTASGFCSFEMEKRGAEVVSFDADSAERIALLPFQQSRYMTHYAEWLAEANQTLDSLKNAYWLAHRLNQSSARAYFGDVYDLPEALGPFDVVVMAQILIHLRDPLLALTQAARRCAHTLVIVEGMIPSKEPIMRLCGSVKSPVPYAWFQLSPALYQEFLAILGFKITRQSESTYSCQDKHHANLIPLTTIVAERVK